MKIGFRAARRETMKRGWSIGVGEKQDRLGLSPVADCCLLCLLLGLLQAARQVGAVSCCRGEEARVEHWGEVPDHSSIKSSSGICCPLS